jgi:hypothetical protein
MGQGQQAYSTQHTVGFMELLVLLLYSGSSSTPCHMLQGTRYSLCRTACAVQLVQYSLCITACAVQLVQYSLCSAVCAVQLVQYSLCSTACVVHLMQYSVAAAECKTLQVSERPTLTGFCTYSHVCLGLGDYPARRFTACDAVL